MTTPDAAPLDPVWAWFDARRAGTRYQPDAHAVDAPDPNGCLPKLAMLRSAAFEMAGSRVIGVGCASAFYETHLAADAVARRGRGAAHLTLIDTDRRALDEAVAALAAPRADSTTACRMAAEHYAWHERFDLCVFLSLYHHYDRLGADARAAGHAILQHIGRHAQAMLFETGQSDDDVAGAAVWRHRVAMNAWPSPRAWLEQEVPRLTGFSRFRHLGTNPTTRRHVYLYWHAPAATASATFGTVLDLASPATPQRDAARHALWCIDGEPYARPSMALADVKTAFATHARSGDQLLTADLDVVRALAPGLPIVLQLDTRAPERAAHLLASAAYAGAKGVASTSARAWPADLAALAKELHLPHLVLPSGLGG